MATQNYFKAKNGLEAPSQSTIAVTDSSFPTVRPTLNLDFAGSEVVDSRITFTRASAATYYGADGKLKYAVQNEPRIEYDPITGECKGLLVEEQRTNLMRAADHVYWSAYHGYVSSVATPNAAIAPDGTLTATLVSETTANDKHCIQTGATTGAIGYYTLSLYVKPNGRTKITFREEYSYGGDIDFDLSTKTSSTGITGLGGWVANSGKIVDIGNGWYRLSATINATVAGTYCVFDVTTNNGSAVSFAGDSTKGFYAWGYQLEAGSFATSYIPTPFAYTSRASSATYFDSTGTLRIVGKDQARYGYGYDSTSGKWISQGLILETASTNLSTYSEDFGQAWGLRSGVSVSRDVSIAPDGNQTADRITQSSGDGYVFKVGSGMYSSNTTYTMSIYAKAVSGTPTLGMQAYWAGGSPTNLGSPTNTLTSSWVRYTFTFTTSTVGTGSQDYGFFIVGGAADVWGFQLELGSVATSYIPTYSTTSTRAADLATSVSTTRSGDSASMTYSNLTNWINQLEGTVLVTFDMQNIANSSTTNGVWSLVEPSYQNRIELINNNGWIPDRYHPIVVNSGGWVVDGGQLSNGYVEPSSSSVTNAFAYKQNDFITSWNGTISAADTSGLLPQATTLYIGNRAGVDQMNGHIKRLTYYPKRLANTQLQALTA